MQATDWTTGGLAAVIVGLAGAVAKLYTDLKDLRQRAQLGQAATSKDTLAVVSEGYSKALESTQQSHKDYADLLQKFGIVQADLAAVRADVRTLQGDVDRLRESLKEKERLLVERATLLTECERDKAELTRQRDDWKQAASSAWLLWDATLQGRALDPGLRDIALSHMAKVQKDTP